MNGPKRISEFVLAMGLWPNTKFQQRLPEVTLPSLITSLPSVNPLLPTVHSLPNAAQRTLGIGLPSVRRWALGKAGTHANAGPIQALPSARRWPLGKAGTCGPMLYRVFRHPLTFFFFAECDVLPSVLETHGKIHLCRVSVKNFRNVSFLSVVCLV